MTTLQRPLAIIAALIAGVLSAIAIAAGAGNSAVHITESAYVSSPPASSAHIVRINPSFVARVNGVCARANAAIQAAHGAFPFPNFDPLHPDPATLPKVGAFFARSQSISDRVPARLEKLGKPRTGRITWNDLLRLAKRFQHIADRQIKAAQAADIPGFVATVRQLRATDTRIKHLGLKAGFQKSSPCSTYY
jgi:hypothetical protein